MCMRADKCTEEQVINAPRSQYKPLDNTSDSTSTACPNPCETLCERVVDFMDTYNEN